MFVNISDFDRQNYRFFGGKHLIVCGYQIKLTISTKKLYGHAQPIIEKNHLSLKKPILCNFHDFKNTNRYARLNLRAGIIFLMEIPRQNVSGGMASDNLKMKQYKMKCVLILFLCIAFGGCKTGEVDYLTAHGDIKIFVAAPMTREAALSNDFNDWALEDVPWIDRHEIDFYDWSANMFYLRRDKERQKYEGRYFVVTSESKRLFYGFFFPIYASYMPPSPSILAFDNFIYPLNLVELGGFYSLDQKITHQSDEFRRALSDAGLLREGISVNLLDVQKSGTGKILYTYKVTNSDRETLLIPDPDKMGADRFHYITNGITMSDGKFHHYTGSSTHTPFNSFDDSWYYALNPGESITRSITQTGFDPIPDGPYSCWFTFPGHINRNKHYRQYNGRIWVGRIRTEKSITF